MRSVQSVWGSVEMLTDMYIDVGDSSHDAWSVSWCYVIGYATYWIGILDKNRNMLSRNITIII